MELHGKSAVKEPPRFVVLMPFSSTMMLLLVVFVSYANSMVQEDRVSALMQVLHGGWKTPWLEMSLSEMPRFMLNEAVLVHPILPKKDENDKTFIWQPDMDAKISFTFSGSKLSAPAILLYSKEGKTLEKVVFTFEHDAYDIISLTHSETYRELHELSMPDLTRKHHPPIDVEYKWVSVQGEDLNLGVKVMFSCTIVMAIALAWVVLMSHDSNSDQSTPARRRPNASSTTSRGRVGSGSAGITVNKRR